jgi:hypothetical protein
LDESKEEFKTLYYSKYLKGKLNTKKPYNAFVEKKKAYKLRGKINNDLKVYRHYAKKRTSN